MREQQISLDSSCVLLMGTALLSRCTGIACPVCQSYVSCMQRQLILVIVLTTSGLQLLREAQVVGAADSSYTLPTHLSLQLQQHCQAAACAVLAVLTAQHHDQAGSSHHKTRASVRLSFLTPDRSSAAAGSAGQQCPALRCGRTDS